MERHQITGHTELIGLLAYPIRHSQSPATHNAAYEKLGVDIVNLAFEVDAPELEDAIKGLRALKLRGANVSMPNKTIVHQYLDEISPAAKLCGAVNTIVNKDGYLVGHITDGIGYVQSLKDNDIDPTGKKVTIVGSGGAATAVEIQAALDGVAEINVFNVRDNFFGRAEEIVAKLNERTECKVTLHDYSDPEILRASIAESAILVNGTSVGMAPNVDRTIITDTSMFHKDLFVFDVIYNPQETRLLREAKEAGCKTGNGMYMLLYQGAASFKLWTGEEMPVEIIKEKYFS